jgi:hypothetical protein
MFHRLRVEALEHSNDQYSIFREARQFPNVPAEAANQNATKSTQQMADNTISADEIYDSYGIQQEYTFHIPKQLIVGKTPVSQGKNEPNKVWGVEAWKASSYFA